MPFDETKTERIIELFNRIEGRKEHDCSAPTYKDSEDLKEMARLGYIRARQGYTDH